MVWSQYSILNIVIHGAQTPKYKNCLCCSSARILSWSQREWELKISKETLINYCPTANRRKLGNSIFSWHTHMYLYLFEALSHGLKRQMHCECVVGDKANLTFINYMETEFLHQLPTLPNYLCMCLQTLSLSLTTWHVANQILNSPFYRFSHWEKWTIWCHLNQ